MNHVRRIETWARLGYAARGLVYFLLGWLAFSSGRALSTQETVRAFDDLPGGDLILIALAVGLFGYGLFKLYLGIVDPEGKGRKPQGVVVRMGRAIGGLLYWSLAWIALRQLGQRDGAAEAGHAAGSGGSAQQAASDVAQASGGHLLLVLAGLIILGLAASQFWIAWQAKFMAEMPGAPRLVRPAGQIGYAARAVVVAVSGYYVLKAGLEDERLRNFGDALALIRAGHPSLFKLVAIGLILFGITSLVMARYRRIADDDVVDRLSRHLPGR